MLSIADTITYILYSNATSTPIDALERTPSNEQFRVSCDPIPLNTGLNLVARLQKIGEHLISIHIGGNWTSPVYFSITVNVPMKPK